MKRLLKRVVERPDPGAWSDGDLMTIPEARHVFWPRGPITESTLRTAIRRGQLAPTRIANKLFVTPAALRAMGRPPDAPAGPAGPVADGADAHAASATPPPSEAAALLGRLKADRQALRRQVPQLR